MKKYIYSKPDGSVSIIIPAPKEALEKVLGPLTDTQYEQHVLDRNMPTIKAENGTKLRPINDSDLPKDKEFRNAWIDQTNSSKVDICCTKAKEIQLGKLREERDKALVKSDGPMTRALEEEDVEAIAKLKAERKSLRDATEGLKALDTTDKVNDETTLEQIRKLGKLK